MSGTLKAAGGSSPQVKTNDDEFGEKGMLSEGDRPVSILKVKDLLAQDADAQVKKTDPNAKVGSEHIVVATSEKSFSARVYGYKLPDGKELSYGVLDARKIIARDFGVSADRICYYTTRAANNPNIPNFKIKASLKPGLN